MKKAFSNELYVELQSKHIQERIAQFDNKLYLEFGGKLFDDTHASRVLPGFEPDSKLKMLLTLKDKVEVIIAVCAKDLERHKMRRDLGISYDDEVIRLINEYENFVVEDIEESKTNNYYVIIFVTLVCVIIIKKVKK